MKDIQPTKITHDEARALAADAIKVIEDFLPNIGRCALQDYGRLNDVMVRARAAGMLTEKPKVSA